MLKTGIFMDALYMNKAFIAEHRDTALAVLKARWEGLGDWSANVEETNKLMADFLQWPEEDIGYVIGTNGKSFEGGIYSSTSTNRPASAVCSTATGRSV